MTLKNSGRYWNDGHAAVSDGLWTDWGSGA